MGVMIMKIERILLILLIQIATMQVFANNNTSTISNQNETLLAFTPGSGYRIIKYFTGYTDGSAFSSTKKISSDKFILLEYKSTGKRYVAFDRDG